MSIASYRPSAARILVIATREDLTIVRETRQLLVSSRGQPQGINVPN
jgi:hypothetical protein